MKMNIFLRSSFRPMVLVSLAFYLLMPRSLSFAATNEPDSSPAKLERRLYVAEKSGLSVYDIDRGHKLIKKIAVPDSGDYKGICASPNLAGLFLTSNMRDELIYVDLPTEEVSWR